MSDEEKSVVLMANSGPRLDLDKLYGGRGLISRGFGSHMAESCALCLDDQGHKSGVIMQIEGKPPGDMKVLWSFEVGAPIRASHNNDKQAVEYGAYAIALLLIEATTVYDMALMSKIGTGFDFWLKKRDSILFQDAVRLEVSGIKSGDSSAIKRRLTQKIAQASLGENVTGYVIIVEFGKPIVAMKIL